MLNSQDIKAVKALTSILAYYVFLRSNIGIRYFLTAVTTYSGSPTINFPFRCDKSSALMS